MFSDGYWVHDSHAVPHGWIMTFNGYGYWILMVLRSNFFKPTTTGASPVMLHLDAPWEISIWDIWDGFLEVSQIKGSSGGQRGRDFQSRALANFVNWRSPFT